MKGKAASDVVVDGCRRPHFIIAKHNRRSGLTTVQLPESTRGDVL